MAMAMTTRWRIPPENSWGKFPTRSAALGIPTVSSSDTALAMAWSLLMS